MKPSDAFKKFCRKYARGEYCDECEITDGKGLPSCFSTWIDKNCKLKKQPKVERGMVFNWIGGKAYGKSETPA